VSTHQRHTRVGDRPPHLVCLEHGQTERLLTQDVLACLSSRHDGLGMEVMWQADVHGVELGLDDHLPKVGVRRGAKLSRPPTRSFLQHIGDGDHLDRIGVRVIAPDMGLQNAAAAQDAYLDRAHGVPIG
jgi:hypothetical protein